MSYSANNYNYATPLSSSKRLVSETFTGLQMLDFDAWIENIASVGVTRGTYSVAGPGKIISITATAADAFTPYLASDAFRIHAKPNTKYTLSYRRSGAAGRVFLFDSGAADNMVQSDANVTYAAITLTTSAETTFITFRVGVSAAGSTATFSEIMLNEGDAAAAYEEYNNRQAYPQDSKFFTLHDNTLDGTYHPITGDVGLWSATLSDANGNLTTPFVVSNTELLTVNSFRLIGAADNYPVAFTVKFYSGDTLLYTITETNNTKAEYIHYLPYMVYVSGIVVAVTKISKANAAARLYNIYNLPYVKRVDTVKAKTTETSIHTTQLYFNSSDNLRLNQQHSRALRATVHGAETLRVSGTEHKSVISARVAASDSLNATLTGVDTIHNAIDRTYDILRIKHNDDSHILNTIDVTADRLIAKFVEARTRVHNTIDVTHDTLNVDNEEDRTLTNVHSRMKDTSRHVYGKVYITYTDPMLDSETTVEASSTAYNSSLEQVMDAVTTSDGRLFTLYENNLTGIYTLSDVYSQVGWTSGVLSNVNGDFSSPAPYLKYSFASRPVINLPIVFDDSRSAIPVNFTVTFTMANGTSVIRTFTDNTSSNVVIAESFNNVVSVTITVTKLSKAFYPVTILEVPITSTVLYEGYKDHSKLMSIDLLEELTYDDDIEALGGVSANEVTVTLDNSNNDFYFNNEQSIIAQHLKRNRKIVPWLGVEIIPGKIEWYTLGTYWAYAWDVPVGSLTAKVTAFDTIGLLDSTSFTNHQMQVNKSIYDLVKYILDDAKEMFSFIEYDIDESLKGITIPYAWFSATSHTAALRKISQCYPVHIYCDRSGRICAVPQKLHLDYYYDTWSDSTNVISKTYSSLYTTLPNVINVKVNRPVVLTNESLAKDELSFNVSAVSTRTLNFSKPLIGNLLVSVTCDSTVSYSYSAYSWGATLSFTGYGNVSAIECIGTALDISNTSVLTKQDADSMRLNGVIVRDISSDFIQTSAHATMLIDRLTELSVYDKYDAEVTYRGDIALSINDPILLLDGIAPDNRYNIKRHQLFWDGALHGVANLNT